MIYRFAEFDLDRSRVELRRNGVPVATEPQVFALLLLLVENSQRMVSREELIEKVWDGRIVSESALDSRVKSARRALGDSGRTQHFIRTIHGRGFRFVAELRELAGGVEAPDAAPKPPLAGGAGRPSIAVLPFRLIGSDATCAAIADALADELIADLSRLRWLSVIARGSSFRFRSVAPEVSEVGALLGVRYCLFGTVEVDGVQLAVTVRLADTRDGDVVWGDRLQSRLADVHATRAAILARVVAGLDLRIPLHEAGAARRIEAENLDAWSVYHLGIEHMFRFNRKDNATAGELFRRALRQDPRFARAHAGLSFVHFQNAFLGYTPARSEQVRHARRHAELGVELDALDPFANLTMGRSCWLDGDLETSRAWFDRATTLSPSYAQAIYARAWTHALSGHGGEGRTDADAAMALSPLDPLFYAMAATRALAHLAGGEESDAALWAERAACSPGAHVLIALIAVAAHRLNGDRTRAAHWARNARERRPKIAQGDFFGSFPFSDSALRQRLAKALASSGIT